jgi:hypothetical protein
MLSEPLLELSPATHQPRLGGGYAGSQVIGNILHGELPQNPHHEDLSKQRRNRADFLVQHTYDLSAAYRLFGQG